MSLSSGPLVSIVTPSFNQAAYLEETLKSVLSQSYPRIEYIVVDGGSTDGTLDILCPYQAKLARWVSEADGGQTDAINKGFAMATGEIFAWLNSDDRYKPQAVAEAVAFLHEHPEVGMVYGDADYVDGHGLRTGAFPAAQTDYRRLRQGYVHIPQQAAFFRARLWHMLGPLDPTFFFAMDYDLWVRIASVSRLKYISQSWAEFRLHTDAKTLAAGDRCWPEMIRVHRRLGGGWLSPIYLRFALRRAIGPLWPLRLRLQNLRQPKA
ncbi:MAG: glycosyltransferase [Anaerolineales bacterium]|nr:glycosyltransferase [Anaerolineales bacterium]